MSFASVLLKIGLRTPLPVLVLTTFFLLAEIDEHSFSERSTQTLTNIALGKKTIASVNEKGAWGAHHLVDGIYTTCWDVHFWKPLSFDHISKLAHTSLMGDQLSESGWAVIDLGDTHKVYSYKLFPHSFSMHGPQLLTSFAIQYWDGSEWREILETYKVITNDQPVFQKLRHPVVTRKIRLYIYSRIKFAPISELEIYGHPVSRGNEVSKTKSRSDFESQLELLIGKGDFISAINLINAEIERSRSGREKAYAILQKALVLQRMGVLEEAVSTYKNLIFSYGKKFRGLERRAREGIGDCYFLENQFNRAKELYLDLYEESGRKDKRLEQKCRFLKEINFRAVRWRRLRGWFLSQSLKEMKFKRGDDKNWRMIEVKDDGWEKVHLPHVWKGEGFGWYRFWIFIPKSWKGKKVVLTLGKISNADQTYFNGELVGRSGRIEPYFVSRTPKLRVYHVPQKLIRFGENNLVAIRVYNETGKGGLYQGPWEIKAESMVKVSNVESPPGNIFHRGEPVSFKLTFKNESDRDEFEIISLWTRNEEVIFKGKKVLVAPKGKEVRWTLSLPTSVEIKNGVYSVSIFSDGECLRRINFAVCPKVKKGFNYNSPFGGQTRLFIDGLRSASRIGIRWLRLDVPWWSVEREKGRWDWKNYDRFFDEARKNGIYLMPIVGWAPPWASPSGFSEPLKKHLPDWERYVFNLINRYKDVIGAIEVCNEVSIGSAHEPWKSTEEKYRQMIKRVYKVVKKFNPKIKVIASNFVSVTGSVIWSDPEMPKNLDGDAPHIYTVGEGFWNTCKYARLWAKKFGKESWLTEYWGGMPEHASERGLVKQSVMALSEGVSKLFPFAMTHYGFFEDVNTFKSPALSCVAYAVMVKFLEGKKFAGYATPDSLPWDFIFEDEEGCVAVVWGINHGYLDKIGEGKIIFKSEEIDGYDILGNKVKRNEKGELVLPLNDEPFYLTSQSKDELIKAIREGKIEGIEPVEIMVEDLQKPLIEKPSLKVVLRNLLPQELNGNVFVSSPLLGIKGVSSFVNLKPGEPREFNFKIQKPLIARKNKFVVEVNVKTNAGDSHLKTEVNQAVIIKGTPEIDGDLQEWEKLGAIPVYLTGEEEFEKGFDRRSIWTAVRGTELKLKGRWAKFMALWDDKNIYFALEVFDPKLEMPLSVKRKKWFKIDPTGEFYLQRPTWIFHRDSFQIVIDKDPSYLRFSERQGCFARKDYEFCFYLTSDGAEAYLCHAPGLPLRFVAPLTKRLPFDQGVVDWVKVVVKRREKEKITVYEVAIPLKELKGFEPYPGMKIGLTFRVNSGDGIRLHYSTGKTTAKINCLTFTSSDYGYENTWSEETYFTFW